MERSNENTSTETQEKNLLSRNPSKEIMSPSNDLEKENKAPNNAILNKLK